MINFDHIWSLFSVLRALLSFSHVQNMCFMFDHDWPWLTITDLSAYRISCHTALTRLSVPYWNSFMEIACLLLGDLLNQQAPVSSKMAGWEIPELNGGSSWEHHLYCTCKWWIMVDFPGFSTFDYWKATWQYWVVPSPARAWQPLRNLRWLHHRQIACDSTVGATARANKNVPKMCPKCPGEMAGKARSQYVFNNH